MPALSPVICSCYSYFHPQFSRLPPKVLLPKYTVAKLKTFARLLSTIQWLNIAEMVRSSV
jgi:hypothetical protein